MLIITQKSDNGALYVLPDDTRYDFTEDGFRTADMFVPQVKPDTHDIQHGKAPDLWIGGGTLAYNGAWTVLNQAAVDEYVAEQQAEVKAQEVAQAQADLAALDLKSTRSMREFLIAKFGSDPLMPKGKDGALILSTLEYDAITLRGKLK